MSMIIPGSTAIRTTTNPPQLGYIVRAEATLRGGEKYDFITQDTYGNSTTFRNVPSYEIRLAEPGQIPPFQLTQDDSILPPVDPPGDPGPGVAS